MPKYKVNEAEAALLLEGLSAGAREYRRMAEDAARLGYAPQAAGLQRRSQEFQAAANLAASAQVVGVTIKHV